MLDDGATEVAAPQPLCMWCSAELPSDHETACPTCGATLIGDTEPQVPGVTAIDAAAIIRAGRPIKPRQRSRLMSWISGEYELEDAPAPPGSLAPPPPAVRREMIRLELEAEVANLQAEAGALAAEQAVETGTMIGETDIGAALAAVTEAARTEAAWVAPERAAADLAPASTTSGAAPGSPPADEPSPPSEDLPPA